MNKWLDDGWMQRGVDALRATLSVDGRLKNQMIEFLLAEGFWDAQRLTPDGANARFNACLDPAKLQYFKLGEVWALMKRFGRHELALAMIDDLGYEVRYKPTEQRRQNLLANIRDLLERNEAQIAAARAELARLDQIAEQRSPAGALDRRGAFSRRADDQPRGF